ncbi:MAG TPA: YbhB/YbcL family Raf kinase inhibitor-like protein [Hanamia sp.]|nr:YbhB/YbcL family Raf kinase inhibitor-like protein [Hanamia sp.]
MRLLSALSAVTALILTSFSHIPSLKITSSAFSNNGNIPMKYTCEGEQVSPPLSIEGMPSGTKSIAIIVHDPDAPMKGGFTHWVVWNIDPSTTTIPEGFKGAEQGLNGAKKPGYIGMCPPTGAHHYHFRVYALDTKLDISKQTGKAGLEKSMQGHILAKGDLVGLYKKMK